MSEDELKKMAIQLIETSKAVFVTTIDITGYPQTRAMFNLRNKELWPKLIPLFRDHKEDFMALFTTNTSSTKITDIRNNSAVSIYYCNPDEWRGMMLSGNIEIVDDPDLKKSVWHDGWEKYYPTGHDDPDHTVLRIFPTAGRGWNQSTTYQFDLD